MSCCSDTQELVFALGHENWFTFLSWKDSFPDEHHYPSFTQLAKAAPATPCHGHAIPSDLAGASRWPWSPRGRRLPFSQQGKTRRESGHVPNLQRPRHGEPGEVPAANRPAGDENALPPPRTGTHLRGQRTIHPGHNADGVPDHFWPGRCSPGEKDHLGSAYSP